MDPELNFETESARTLAIVRELSENATLRPAPRVLCCVLLQANRVLQPMPFWKRKYIQIIEAFAGVEKETA